MANDRNKAQATFTRTVPLVGFGSSSDLFTAIRSYVFPDLGEYIYAANPYMAGLPPKDTWAKVSPPPVVRLVTNPADDHDFQYSLDTRGIEHHEKPGDWEFKHVEHAISRALKIPYLYYKKVDQDPATGILVRDYFLIGFAGGISY